MSVYIRRFEEEDAVAVSNMVINTLQVSNIRDYSLEMIEYLVSIEKPEDILKQASRTHFYVAVEDDRIVGSGAIGKHIEDVCRLYTIFVLPQYQGRGIGKRLIEVLEKDEYALMAKRIELHASITGLRFYKALGYDFKDGKKELDDMDLYWLEKVLR